MKTLVFFLSAMMLFTFSGVYAQDVLSELQQTIEKQRCGLTNEKLNVTANYYRDGGKVDVYVTYPDKETNDQITVANLTAYVYEGNNTLKKSVKNGNSTLTAGGKQINIQLSGVYPKDAKTNLDIVVSGEIKDKLGIGGMTTACGGTGVRTQ